MEQDKLLNKVVVKGFTATDSLSSAAAEKLSSEIEVCWLGYCVENQIITVEYVVEKNI